MSTLEIILYIALGLTALIIATKTIIKAVQIKKGTYKPKQKRKKDEEEE